MLAAIAHGAENNPPLYTLLLRGWSALVGTGALALRVLSAACFCGALAIMWRTLRPMYATRQVALGIAVVFFGVQALFEQAAQARFYGLFFLIVAIAFAVAVRTTSAATLRWSDVAAMFVAHTLLVYTHMFGLLFSGAILVGVAVLDVRRRRFRGWIYLAVLAAWLLWGLYAPFLLGGAMVMRGARSWLARPQREDLIRLIARQTTWLPFVAAIAVFFDFFRRRDADLTPTVASDRILDERRESAIVFAVALIAVVPLVFVISRIAAPAFLDRYLLPAALGWIVVTAELIAALGSTRRGATEPKWMAPAFGVLFAGLALYPVSFAVAKPPKSQPGLAVADSLGTVPVVLESGHDFWPMQYYAAASPAHGRYRFLLDSSLIMDPENFAGAGQEYQLMKLYSDEGYLDKTVTQLEAFACETPRFLIVDRPDFTLFERRFTDDARFRTRAVGTYDGAPVRLIERVGAGCSTASPNRPATPNR
jgi:hypothetical protein